MKLIFITLVAFAIGVMGVPMESNATVPNDGGSNNITDSLEEEVPGGNVQVYIGHIARNVGTIGNVDPSDLYGKIWTTLDAMCPDGSTECRESSRKIPVLCPEGHILVQKDLEVKVLRSYYGTNMRLRRLMIGSIAGAMQKSIESDANCYNHYKNIHERPIKLCNVAHVYGVDVREDHLNIALETPTNNGKWDCNTVQGPTDKYIEGLLAEYAQALGGGEVTKTIYCSGQPN
ncbi:hypothetical protein BS50DRAFT_648854 [Corynespora cassiicola Philippines]|uniref:Uncharacterized protein n=1 Tax=Corynespora cassiicola Philippines TaxID=1448308 RepID=A0A2T2ND34_CORCC|nr:hypothetical protein BS50DRAFT_648854 [Corynespora cassiicola Philippines]